jgi:four helix bundle protein
MATFSRRDVSLASQMRRATASVALCLAEGARRSGKHRLHLYRIAAGSAAEVRAALSLARIWGWTGSTELASAEALLDRVAADAPRAHRLNLLLRPVHPGRRHAGAARLLVETVQGLLGALQVLLRLVEAVFGLLELLLQVGRAIGALGQRRGRVLAQRRNALLRLSKPALGSMDRRHPPLRARPPRRLVVVGPRFARLVG